MNERYITLLGAEQVQSAARQMQSAADGMRIAANHFDDAMRTQQRWMDEWLQRLETVLERAPK